MNKSYIASFTLEIKSNFTTFKVNFSYLSIEKFLQKKKKLIDNSYFNSIFSIAVFHDCVGSCNACINVDNPENAGLELAVEILEDIYEKVETAGIEVSRADVWVIAGRIAAENGMETMPGHIDSFRGYYRNTRFAL